MQYCAKLYYITTHKYSLLICIPIVNIITQPKVLKYVSTVCYYRNGNPKYDNLS